MRIQSKYILLEISAVLFVLTVLTWYSIPRFIASQNINTPTHFPDTIFRQSVEKILGVDEGGHFTPAQTREVKELMISTEVGIISFSNQDTERQFKKLNKNSISRVTNLSGLQYFPSITKLNVVITQCFSELNLSKNKRLEEIKIYSGAIKSASFSLTPSLEVLYLRYGKLESLDISNNPHLSMLHCDHNQLKELNLNQNSKLFSLNCGHNQISIINLSHNPKLKHLTINNNHIKDLDVSKSNQLYRVDIANNPITEINLSNQEKLWDLVLDYDQFYHADIKLHPSVSPRFIFRTKSGGMQFYQNFTGEKRDKTKARIEEILGRPYQTP